MHLQYVADVRSLLKASSNTLVVVLSSPVAEAAARAKAYPYEVPRTMQIGSLDNGNFVRKAASDFGWSVGSRHTAHVVRAVSLMVVHARRASY